MAVYVFDMDGTLTPARLPMTAEFAADFYEWQKNHKCFIATGSDLQKVKEQLPQNVVNSFSGIYSSMGNVLTEQGAVVYKRNFSPEPELLNRLEQYRQETAYPGTLYSNYIEERVGMINFSILGRSCPFEERNKYGIWDKENCERLKIAEELRTLFPQYDVSIGGSISIDITPKGFGKEQIARHLRESYPNEKLVFFGDRTFKGGNDYELAQALLRLSNTQVVQVSSPEDVLMHLKNKEFEPNS